VTNYYYKNPNLGDKIPTITDTDLNDFKAYIKKEKININTDTEIALKSTLEKAKKDNIDSAILSEYQQLLTAVQKSEETMIDKNSKEIKNLILDEIIKRYQYKEGLYQYYIKNNAEVKKAVLLLNDKTAFSKILK
jgi:carboxyl-terminal processing protease